MRKEVEGPQTPRRSRKGHATMLPGAEVVDRDRKEKHFLTWGKRQEGLTYCIAWRGG
jgi:hypothetical protein